MKHSFGSSEGRAAVVKKNHELFTAYFEGEEHLPKARLFFKKVKPKFACKTKVIVEIRKKEN